MNRELKECPFCGNIPKVHVCNANGSLHTRDLEATQMRGQKLGHCMIICEHCGIRTSPYLTRRGAFNAWNRRNKEN